MFLILLIAFLFGGLAFVKLLSFGLLMAIGGSMIAASFFAALAGATIFFSNHGPILFRGRTQP